MPRILPGTHCTPLPQKIKKKEFKTSSFATHGGAQGEFQCLEKQSALYSTRYIKQTHLILVFLSPTPNILRPTLPRSILTDLQGGPSYRRWMGGLV